MTAPPLTAFREFLVRLPKQATGPLPLTVRKQIAQVLVSDSRRRFQTATDPGGRPWKPLKHRRPNGGDKPLRDTGVLRNSITGEATATGAVVFSNLPYARLHEYGGTVRPKRSKYLAIPLTRDAKRTGSPRRFRVKLSFRPFKRKGTGGVLFVRRAGTTIDHYLLVKSVTIPARPFLSPSDAALKLIDGIVSDATAAQLPGA
jgi:phage virion morphogenesis protein